jgi:intracellular septation protein
MAAKPLNPALKAWLEFGPIIGFFATYLILRNGTYLIGGIAYSGFVVVIAAVIPIFLIALAAQWYLTGRVARLQVATALLVLVFGGLSVWLNDARVFKMKPTAIYLLLAITLSIGLARGAL